MGNPDTNPQSEEFTNQQLHPKTLRDDDIIGRESPIGESRSKDERLRNTLGELVQEYGNVTVFDTLLEMVSQPESQRFDVPNQILDGAIEDISTPRPEFQRAHETLEQTVNRLVRKYGPERIAEATEHILKASKEQTKYPVPPKGTKIGIREAGRKYSVPHGTIGYWSRRGYVARLEGGVDEHDVAHIINTPLLRGGHRGRNQKSEKLNSDIPQSGKLTLLPPEEIPQT